MNSLEKMFNRIKDIEEGMTNYGKLIQDLVSDLHDIEGKMTGRHKEEGIGRANMTGKMMKRKTIMEELQKRSFTP